MIIRAFSSTTAALAITLGLFYVMQGLIASGEEVVTESRVRHVVPWVRVPEPVDPDIDPPKPEPIDDPPVAPPTNPPEAHDDGGLKVGVGAPPPRPRPGGPEFTGPGQNNNVLMNVIKVQPSYPPIAAARGLEGTVIVRFDVTPMGTVENVVVVDSTHRIFEKAAIEAAYRFKYRPRYVDGTPFGATGLQQRFRFEMDN